MSLARGAAAFALTFLLAAALAAGCANKGAGTESGTGGAYGAGGASGGAGGATGTGGASAGGATGGGGNVGAGAGGAAGAASGSGGSSAGTGGRAATDAGRDSGPGDVPTDVPTDVAPTLDGGPSTDVIANFHNAVFWNDDTGKRIEAHGGGFFRAGDTWYWIGEDKSQNSGNFNAVNCYSSKDMTSWHFERAIITRSTTSTLATAGRIIERPKLTYNDSTQQYVMWLHWDGNSYGDAEAGVFSSATICGSYTYKKDFRPNNNMSRDDTLFKDDDGKAYFISAANNNADLIIYELTADYLDVARQVATLWAGSSREAPAMFKQGGRYYLITSAATGWDSNQAKYGTATAIGGPWSALTNVGDSTTFDTQAAYVIPVVGSQATTYIYASDRWQDPDLVSSKYIWLPLKVNGTTLTMDYYDRWQLDITTGVWSVQVADGFVPQSGWKLIHADSEETQGEDGRAINAFDNSASTIWHTQYTGTTPAHPHEIQIDLGATYAVAGMRYLPRQDKDDHGMVAGYQFYVTMDMTNWGTAVASGTFNSDRTEKIVMFPKMNARYIRFVATSEINGQAWTSVAELDLVPAP